MKLTYCKVLSVISITLALAIGGCSDSSDETPVTQTPLDDESSGETPVAQSASSLPETLLDDESLEQLSGIWERRGYGNLFEFENSRTTLFSVTDTNCLEVESFEGVAGYSPEELALTRFDLQGDELLLLFPGDAFAVRLNRLDSLPDRCDEQPSRDAQAVFDYLWNTFDQYYAFFDLRGVDWAAEYASQVTRIGEVSDDEGLFNLLSDLLSPINDSRVQLGSDDMYFTPAVERGYLLELDQGFDAQSEITDFEVYANGVIDTYRQNIGSRLDADSITDEGQMIWATAAEGTIGYLFIRGMGGFKDNATRYEDLQAAQTAMDRVMTDLANTDRLIVDLRLNGGGIDSIALDFASRFVSDPQTAFTRTARGRNFESTPVEALLEPPATGSYLKPISLIVGTDTVGPAELFAIALHRQPQVTVIGENTAGSLSEFLVKPLPNGWVTALSNEVYLDSEGVSFEKIGLTPDIMEPVFQLESIFAGEDPALDRALSMP